MPDRQDAARPDRFRTVAIGAHAALECPISLRGIDT
jgi:hypothetical protein